jgi:protein kinase C substrate 80K-H
VIAYTKAVTFYTKAVTTRTMIPWLLVLPLPVLAGIEKTTGVQPALLSAYSPPKSGLWKCLDGSKDIPWDFVNDDSCDCPDGSDEPGWTH